MARPILRLLLALCCITPYQATSGSQGIEIDGKKYAYAYEMKCRVAKAVPAPEKGPTWYTSSDIGDVWMKFTPTRYSPGKGSATFGTILMFRTDRVYKELVTYPEAWWTWSDESEEIQGTAKFGSDWSTDNDENPFFFSISKIDEDGMFHGSDGKPKYLLSRCTILDALATYPSFREQFNELFGEPVDDGQSGQNQ